MRSGSPSALRTTCFSHTFSTNVFGLSISVLPILRVLVSFPTIVDREPVIFVSTTDPLETGLPEPGQLRQSSRFPPAPQARGRAGHFLPQPPPPPPPPLPPFPVERLLL